MMRYFKYLPKAYAEDMVKRGFIRIGTLQEFRSSYSSDLERGDPTEGSFVGTGRVNGTYDLRKDILPMGLGETITGRGKVIFNNSKVNIGFTLEDVNLYCVTTSPSEKDMMKFGCDACVEVLDIITFQNIIVRYLAVMGISSGQAQMGPCTYAGKEVDYYNSWMGPYAKPKEYENQHEFRLLFEKRKNAEFVFPYIIRIGALTKIVKMHEF